MNHSFRYFFLLVFIITLISCKKKTPENIGLPLLPGGDLLNAEFSDSATLITHTVKDDSLLTAKVSPMLLGQINDPVFGIAKASIYTQLYLQTANPSFGSNPVLDSAVLSLVYKDGGYYGTLYSQKFKVYALDESLYKDSLYYSNRTLSYSSELATVYLAPNPTDSVTVDTIKFPPHLRLSLNKNFFQEFLYDSYTSAYSSNDNFQNFFKGIYVTTASGAPSGEGAILYLDVTNSFSRLTLYYHNDTSDSLSYYFSISASESARFVYFEHNYSGATDIQNQLNTADTIQADMVYVQPMAGVRVKITMPYIKDFFAGGKVAINKAELFLPAEPASVDSPFYAHPKLVATIADKTSGPLAMPDYYEGSTYFGGDYDETNKVYKFNIARYIQQVLNGTLENQGLYIIANARPTTANRTVLLGGNKSLSNRMRLKITYTPLE